MKKQIDGYNMLAIVLLNIAFWICDSYPRHIFTQIEPNSSAILPILLNIIFFIIYFLVLMIFFTKSKTVFSKDIFSTIEPFHKRFCLGKIGILLAVQTVMEIVIYWGTLMAVLGEYYVIAIDAFTLINWLAVYFVLTFKSESFFKNKKLLAWFALVSSVLLAATVLFDLRQISVYQSAMQKYEPLSAQLQAIVCNLDFESDISNLIFDCALGCLVVLFHAFSLNRDREVDKQIEGSELARRYYRSHTAIIAIGKVFVLVFAIAVMLTIKAIVCPNHFIRHLNVRSSSFRGIDEGAYSDASCFKVSRISRYGEEEVVYAKTATKISYNENVLLRYTANDDYIGYSTTIVGNVMEMDNGFEEYNIGDIEASTYNNNVICYKENGEMQAVLFSDIAQHKESDVLTTICEQLISEGNLKAFECGYEYLLKYDKDFIEPYISRYSAEDFTADEEDFICNSGYRKDYIVNIAKSVNVDYNQ